MFDLKWIREAPDAFDEGLRRRGLEPHAEMVIALTGSRSTIEYVPYSEAYGHDFEDVRRRVPDVSRLAATVGCKPAMPIEAILESIIRWKQRES